MCETFDHLFTLLEEKKAEMTVRINSEQEEKLDYIRSLNRKYGEHLEGTAKLVETAIQTMEEPEMAVFLQVSLCSFKPSRAEQSWCSGSSSHLLLRLPSLCCRSESCCSFLLLLLFLPSSDHLVPSQTAHVHRHVSPGPGPARLRGHGPLHREL